MTNPPISLPEVETLAWVAGFLEGEGSFLRWRVKTTNGYKYYALVKASQVNREPLDQLRDLLGGSICLNTSPARRAMKNRQPLWCWSLFGKNAETVIWALMPWMSEKRKAQMLIAAGEEATLWR